MTLSDKEEIPPVVQELIDVFRRTVFSLKWMLKNSYYIHIHSGKITTKIENLMITSYVAKAIFVLHNENEILAIIDGNSKKLCKDVILLSGELKEKDKFYFSGSANLCAVKMNLKDLERLVSPENLYIKF